MRNGLLAQEKLAKKMSVAKIQEYKEQESQHAPLSMTIIKSSLF